MKKFLSAALCCTVLSTSVLFGGCAADSKAVKLDQKNPVTISIWHYYNGPQKTAFDSLITEFNETVGMEQGIIAEGFNQGNVTQLTDSILASAENKVGTDPIPNIFAAYADTAYQIDKKGLVANLVDYLTEEEIKEYIPSYIQEGDLNGDGSLKIFPTAKSTEIFMLNQTDWEPFAAATGAKTEDLSTIEGLVKVSEAYYNWTDSLTPDVKEDGKAFFGRDAMANYFIIGCKQLGTEIFSVKDGKVTFQVDEAVMRTLWNNYYVPYLNGYFAANGQFRSEDAKIGDILALVGSTTSATYFPKEVFLGDKESYPIETLVLPAPKFAQGKNVTVQQGAGMVVTKATPQKEYASTIFLKWFTEAERNLGFSILSGYLPVKTEANDLQKLTTALKAQESDNGGLLLQTFEAALKSVNSDELYTNRAFEGGTSARAVLENSMQTLAKQDREAVLELIAGGETRENAVAKYNSDEHYKAWLAQFQQELSDTQKG